MLFVTVFWTFVLLAGAEEQTNQTFYPNCDLVACSYVHIEQNENGTVDISFSWDRKKENYAQIDGPITQYVIRHGPQMNGTPVVNESKIITAAPDKDAVTLRNVVPCDKYFIQVCAVSKSYRFLFQDDVWDHAWSGWMGLESYKQKTPILTTKHPFNPECDLVQTSYVSLTADKDTKTLRVLFSWDKRESSYESVGAFDHYLVRHGPVFGGEINENGARYMPLANDTTSFTLTDIQPGGTYGLQICMISTDDMGIDQGMNWNRKAWLGTLDLFGTYDGLWAPPPDMNDTTIGVPSEDLDVLVANLINISAPLVPIQSPKSFTPRCDLVGQGLARVQAFDQQLLVNFAWDKKRSSYDQLGYFNTYIVRYGPWCSKIKAITEARFTTTYTDVADQGKSQVLFEDVPSNSDYGFQICALVVTDDRMNDDWENLVNWTTEAWTGVIRTGPYQDYAWTTVPTLDTEVTEDSTPVYIQPRQPYTPRCNLVEKSNVTIILDDKESKQVMVSFGWEKKTSSYDSIGPFDHYLVLNGPMRGGAIEKSSDRYLVFTSEATDFNLFIPYGTEYGVSICAIQNDDFGIDDGFDWRNKAWLGKLDFSDYERSGHWVKMDDEDPDERRPAIPGSQIGPDPDESYIPMGNGQGILVEPMRAQLGSNYGIILVVVSILGLILVTGICVGLFVVRRRRQAKNIINA